MMKQGCGCLLLLILAAGRVAAAPAVDAPDPALIEKVRRCVESNAPTRSSVLAVSLEVTEPDEEPVTARFKVYWRRLTDGVKKVLIRFSAPADLDDAALLVENLDEERPRVHLFLPDLGKPRRVTSRDQLENFLGRADLGLGELSLLLSPLRSRGLRVVDAAGAIDGRSTWVVERVADPESNDRYRRTVTFVDREFCVPIRAEFYTDGSKRPRLMSVDPSRVLRERHSWVPRELVFRDPSSESVSVLRVDEVEIDIPLAPSLLTVPALTMGGG